MNIWTKRLKAISNQFKTKERDSGEKIIIFETGGLDLYGDFSSDIHGTDILPDNYRYEIMCRLTHVFLDWFEWNADKDDGIDELREFIPELVDLVVDYANADLTEWLASHLSRIEWCNEAIEMGTDQEITNILAIGQYLEISAIAERYCIWLEMNNWGEA